MASGFIEVTKDDGKKMTIAIDHIVCFEPCGDMTVIYTDSNKRFSEVHLIMVSHEYSQIKQKLQACFDRRNENGGN